MNESILQWLAQGPLITDGGWGTQLQQRGLPLGAHPDLWNISEPQQVEAVAASYVQAGSDVILTNTFGANKFLLTKHNAQNQVREINIRGAEISRKAVDAETSRNVRVFASMGPTGILLMMKSTSTDEIFDAFVEQAAALKEGGADALVVETMSDPQELELAVRAAKTTDLPVVASMTFDSGKNRDRTMMGTTPEQAVEAMTRAGADVIGSNCGQGIEGFIPICSRYRAVSSLPIWMKGNAGLPEVVDGKTVYRQKPDIFAAVVKQLIEVGANFVGGCCGTDPQFIAAVRKIR